MLSSDQFERYQKDGILFPIRVLPDREAARFRRGFEELEAQAQAPQNYVAFSHLFFPWSYELITHPAVVAAATSILGPDVLVDGSLMLCKHAHDGTFAPWHQDGTYSNWHTTPSVSAWIALTASTRENGCMRVVPGSHAEGRYGHHTTADEKCIFAHGPEIEVEVDENRALDVELRPGEMSLHHSSIIHGSAPNRSASDRLGFIIRFITPAFQARKSILPVVRVSGAADCGALEVLAEPPAGDSADCFRRWKEACPFPMPRGNAMAQGNALVQRS